MARTVVGYILVMLGLLCVGSTMLDWFRASTRPGLWSAEIMGAAAFHATCMISASFLLAQPATHRPTEEDA